MNRKLKQKLKLLNITLNTIAINQALLYLKLEQLEQCMSQEHLDIMKGQEPKGTRPSANSSSETAQTDCQHLLL